MNTQFIVKYSLASRLIHWLVALMVSGLFGLGLWMRELDYYSQWYQTAPQLHVLIGLILALLMIGRVVVRWNNSPPKPLSTLSTFEIFAAHAAHALLYLFIFIMIVSGYLVAVADGDVMNILGWFDLPVMESLFERQEDLMGDIHEWLAWGLIIFAGLHGIAALKHHFISGDDTLRRML